MGGPSRTPLLVPNPTGLSARWEPEVCPGDVLTQFFNFFFFVCVVISTGCHGSETKQSSHFPARRDASPVIPVQPRYPRPAPSGTAPSPPAALSPLVARGRRRAPPQPPNPCHRVPSWPRGCDNPPPNPSCSGGAPPPCSGCFAPGCAFPKPPEDAARGGCGALGGCPLNLGQFGK